MSTNHIAYVDRAQVWKDVFHEDFAPVMRKTVKEQVVFDIMVAWKSLKEEL